MRDYNKPLTIVLTGDGESTKANSTTLLEDLIYGNLPASAQVDVKLIVPYDRETKKVGKGLVDAIQAMKDLGVDGEDFLPIVEPDCGHPSLTSAEKTSRVDQGDALADALNLLKDAHDSGENVFFVLLHDPKSVRDISDITDAKQHTWLTTLNLSEGLIDSFEGYESAEDRIKREELEAGYAELRKQQEAEEEAANPKPAKKRAVKKATEPRKRSVSISLEAEDVPLVDEPEKAPVEPPMASGWGSHKHKFVWGDDGIGHAASVCECGETEELTGTKILIADGLNREKAKKVASTELSGTVVMGGEVPESESLDLALVETADVWKDVAKAVPGDITHFSVPKADIVELGEAMEEMANAFGKAIRVYKNIVDGN